MACSRYLTAFRTSIAAPLIRLRSDKQGGITYIGILLAVMILFFAGFAVDSMRVESRRVQIQSALDAGVLAAADSDQARSERDVIRDYMTVAGFPDALVPESDVNLDIQGTVAAVRTSVPTIFSWPGLGIARDTDHTDITVVSAARNNELEVSLVFDISGSMGTASYLPSGAYSGTNRMGQLRKAAKTFIDTILTAETHDQVSITLVPYSEDVSVGETFFKALNTNQVHSSSWCLEIPDQAFSVAAFDRYYRYDQVPHINWAARTDAYGRAYPEEHDMSRPICPSEEYEGIYAFSQNAAELKRRLELMQPRGTTATNTGVRWGLSFLDPGGAVFREALDNAGELDSAFRNRPTPYSSATVKAIVIMTDGLNTPTYRPLARHYDTEAERNLFATTNFRWWYQKTFWWDWQGNNYVGDGIYIKRNGSRSDYLMEQVCKAARDQGVVIYGIAVDMSTTPSYQLEPFKRCVGDGAHYFEVSSSQLETVFQQIALDLRRLRLVQ